MFAFARDGRADLRHLETQHAVPVFADQTILLSFARHDPECLADAPRVHVADNVRAVCRLQVLHLVLFIFAIPVFFVLMMMTFSFAQIFATDGDADIPSECNRQFLPACFLADLLHFSADASRTPLLIIDIDMSEFPFPNKLLAFENRLHRVPRRANQSDDSNQQRAHLARQIAMNHFEAAIDAVTLVISSNQLHLSFLDLIEAVFGSDEQTMPCLEAGVPSTHAQKLETARVLSPNPLHQDGQQAVKSIDETKSLMTLA